MNSKHLEGKKIILGSGSPRRKELLGMLGYTFEVRKSNADEIAPANLNGQETAVFIAMQKAQDLSTTLSEDELLITSDTEVWLDNRRFGKPSDEKEAFEMLNALSGNTHQVISGICLMDNNKTVSKAVTTQVKFKKLSVLEMEYYIKKYKPFDKAGGYGIQEWIGLIGVEKIEGSYFNVVGLPVFELAEILNNWDNPA